MVLTACLLLSPLHSDTTDKTHCHSRLHVNEMRLPRADFHEIHCDVFRWRHVVTAPLWMGPWAVSRLCVCVLVWSSFLCSRWCEPVMCRQRAHLASEREGTEVREQRQNLTARLELIGAIVHLCEERNLHLRFLQCSVA